MKAFLGIRELIFLCVLLMFCGFVLHSVGTSTPKWSVLKGRNSVFQGVFFYCSFTECGDYFRQSEEGKHKSSQVFSIAGILGGATSSVLGIIHVCLTLLGRNSDNIIVNLASVFSALAGVSSILCVIIWTVVIHNPEVYHFGYSFHLSEVGGCLMTVGGVLALVMGKLQSRARSTPGQNGLRKIYNRCWTP